MVLMVFSQLEDLPFTSTVIFRERSPGHRGGHLGNVPHLGGEVAGEEVHVVGEVLPVPAAPGTLA
jgi:hypothetical protein